MSLTAVAFWLVYVGGLAAAIFNPVIGIALYLLVYHLNPESQWWGASVSAAGLRTSMTVALATAIGMFIRQPRLRYGASQFPAPFIFAILLCLLAVGSLTWDVPLTSSNVEARSVALAEKFVKILIFVFLLVRCVRTPLQYQIVFYSWLAGLFYIGYQMQGGIGLYIGGRLTGGLGGPDFAESSGLGVHMTAALPLIGAAFFMARTWWGRSFALIVGALTVNTLIATRTRNVIVGVAALTFVGLFSLPRRYRLKGFLAIILGGLLAIQLADPGWWNRIASLANYQEDPSATGRLEYWRAALQMAFDYPFGIGIGNFQTWVLRYVPHVGMTRSAHNTVMECLAELGWLGLFAYIAVIGTTLRQLGQVARTAKHIEPYQEVNVLQWRVGFHLGWHAMALRTGLLGYVACAMFVTRLVTEDFWLLIGLTMALHNVSKHMVGESLPARDEDEAPDTAPAIIPDQPVAAAPRRAVSPGTP